MPGSPLTELQERYELLDARDMSAGYPRIEPLAEQWTRFRSLVAGLSESPASRDDVIDGLTSTVRTLLHVPADVPLAVTFSGSIALERVIGALAPANRDTLVTIPGFDSIYSFVKQASGREPRYLEISPFAARAGEVDRIVAAIDSSIGAVVLISPNNPTGLTLSPSELEAVAQACAAVDAVLIVDHCFALVQPADDVSGSAFELGGRCRWAALWDSSKTLELLGEKFGVISASPAEMQAVVNRLEEIQLDLPIGSLHVIGAALRDVIDGEYLRDINELVVRNYGVVRQTCEDLGARVNEPDGGSFALIDVEGSTGWSARALSEKLAVDEQIAVVPADVLYPAGQARSCDFLRISLMRPEPLVREFCEALRRLLG